MKSNLLKSIFISLILVMGVNNAWAASTVQGGYIYFDATKSGWSVSDVQMVVGHNSYSAFYGMSKISNTSLYYLKVSGWNDATYFAFANGCSTWGAESSNYDNRKSWITGKYTAAKTSYTLNNNNSYLFYASTSSNNASITTSSPAGHLSGGYSALNSEQTIKSAVNGADANSKATISITSYKMTSNGQVTEQTATLGTGAKDSYITAARTATTTLTVGDVEAGYQFDGWYTAATGGTQLETKKTYTYYPTAATTVYARFSENTYTVTIKNDGHGTTNPTGAQSNVGQVTGLSIKATPAANYEFVNWTITSGSGSFGSTTSASTTFKPTSAATIQANFRSTATNSLTVAAGAGIASVAGSTDPITLGNTYDIKATPKTGYTFSTWTANPAANASFGSATTANTTVTVKNGSVTVTASATENMSTLTTSNKYDAGNPGYAVPTALVNSIGYETTATVTATAAGNGYTFTGWTLTNCTRTDGGAADATSITVRSNGDGKAATVVANYAEDLTSEWHLVGNGNIFPDGWNVNNNSMMKKISGKSTESIVALKVNVTTVQTYEFKIVDDNGSADDTWYGYSTGNTFLTWTATSTKNVYSGDNNANNLKFTPKVAGEYEFKVDYSGTYPAVTITYPTSYTVTYSRVPTAAADAPTTSPSVSSGNSVVAGTSVTFTAKDAKPGYIFKGWYNNNAGDGTALSSDLTYTCTINANTNIYAVYTTDTYNITYTAPTHGTFTIQVGSNTPVNANTTADYKTTITLSNTPATGYHFVSWNITPSVSITDSKTFLMPAHHVTIGVIFEPNTYKVKFDANSGTGTMSDLPFTYDIAQNLTANVFERTGYIFSGWNTNADGTGTTYTDGKSVQNLTAENEGTVTLYAQWTAKTYPVTLQHSTIEGYGSGGTSSVTATYGDDMPSIPELPTAKIGYAFMGYFDQKDGKGTQYYDSVGTSAHTWDKTEKDTLYAYFKAAEITINLNAASFEPNSATPVIATATLKPTPVGTTSICWELLYNDDTSVAEHDPQPTGDNQVQFNINDLATGTYQIKATLREGAGCTGTIISHATQVFTITSDHTITIRYVDENGQTIKASTTQSAHVSSLTEITAPEIIGYTFKEWEAGDGVSIKDATDGKKNTATIEYNAYYDGYLKAIYTKNSNIIYFYNTLGWENVYVYFYSGDYWDSNKGTGTKSGGTYKEYLPMVRMGESNIWYVNAADKATTYLVFGKDEQNNEQWFNNTSVARRGDYNSKLPMFVPIADQEPTELNNYTDKEGKKCVTKYYDKGYWMNYPENPGYTLDLFNHHTDNDPARYFIYPYSQDTIFPLQIQVDINAENIADDGKKKIWFRIHRNDGKNFGGHATNFPSVKPGTTGGFITENDYKVELITPIAGTYTFILDYKYDEKAKDYKYHISVDYPAAVGDYRILYRDAAEKTWSGKDKNKEGDEIKWYHASRVIKKGTDTKDIISFFINKDIRRTLSYQTIEAIDKDGNITWSKTEVEFSHVDWSQIDTSGVYNFVFVQDGRGISLDNIEPYTGNYYIRCDAMDGNWEDYKTNPDNRMFYSAFSESEANSFGDKFSHYATKWCEAGTNVKFTIANDYSHCISDTLAQDINSLGNLTDEGTLLNNDIYDVNIRFMWNWKTNKISRAYVGPAGDKQSQFLMLKACEEIQDAEGNKLNPAEGDILDKENDIYAARFTDTQNWIYERTIQVKPRTRVKLYASYPNGYHIYIENNTGWKDVALYAFKNGGDKPLGNWPGVQPTRTVEIEGKTYYDFPINKYVFGSKLIFNNNGGGQQKDDYQIQTIGDYYLTASSSKSLSRVKFVSTTVEATAQYFRGEYAEGSCDDEHTIQILGGEGETWNTIRVIYDFKTNRLMAAWMPNNNEIDIVRSIESDVMIIRDHQNAAQCITFANDSSKLTYVKTVYGVMRFNRWILNNRGGADNLDIESCTKVVDNQTVYDHDITNQYHPILEPSKQTSQYERALYFISFPFDVHLSDVFGFGTYGQHWIIEYYDGLKRAKEGYWIDSDPNWKYVTDPANFVLEKYKGYILCLNLGKMAYDNTDFWAHNISQVELFFPSTTTMEEIAKAEVTMPKLGEEYLCKINRGDGTEGDRRVKDSYWRCIGVPSYANYSNVLKDEEGNPIQWQTSYKTFPFLYKWNKTDNTLTPQSTTNFKFETMHAYLVQNGGEIHWSAVNATPDKPNAGIIAKVKETTRNYEWRITLTQGEKEQDQAFVRLSDNEQVTTEFDFNQDLSKEFNYGRSDIYTLIGYEKAAANSLPFSEQTTLIPLGLSIEYNGDYTIAMPDGTANIGVTLIDTESNTRTNLSAGMEYKLTLKKGDYNNRFFIEISPIQQTPTDIEYVENSHDDQARKVLIDNILYIVRDGQIFDARGARVK